MPTIPVLDSTIAYREVGSGDVPFVFLHGNPMSSYLWRRVLPGIGLPGRCLAPDLIGMGESGKPDIAYRFDDHARFLDAWFDALGLDDVVLVGHDWGGALAFDWATRHRGRTRGIAFLETILRPMSWADFPPSARPLFQSLRSDGVGEKMALQENVFIEQVLPRTVAGLSEDDLKVYRSYYPTPASRLPLLQWPRAMPIDRQPADVITRVEAYDQWLQTSLEVPKLLLTFDPTPAIMIGPEAVEWCRQHIAALDIDHCGAASHHAPEEQPEAISAAIAAWANRHDLRTARTTNPTVPGT